MKNFSFKLFTALLALMLNFNQFAYAQTEAKSFVQKSKMSDFVFEGTVIDQISDYSGDKATIFTKNSVRVQKIFQGTTSDTVIVVTTLGGLTEDRFLIYGKALQLNVGDEGLFWVKKGSTPFETSKENTSNAYWALDQSDFLAVGTKCTSDQQTDFSLNLFDEVLGLLGTPNMEYPKGTLISSKPTSDCSDPDFENWAQISLENLQVTNGLTEVECDVVLKIYPAGLKFGKGAITLTLPKSVFGTNAVANQNLIVQKGEVITDANYTISYSNLTDSTVIVQVNQQSPTGYAFELGSSFKKLIHLKAKILNPFQVTSLKPESFNFSGELSYICRGRQIPFARTNFVNPPEIVLPNYENPIGIHYTLDRFYYNNNNVLYFDILASSDAASDYKSGKLYIDYDDATFGSNIAGGITNVTGLLAGNSTYTVGVYDHDANTLRIEILGLATTGLITLQPDPQLLLRCQVYLPDCNKNLELKWNPLTISPDHTYIENNVAFQYMPVTTSGEFLNKICACNESSIPDDPKITSISKPKVKAGVGEILTIFGDKFGNGFVDGQCYIEVDNADHSPSDRTKVPSADIISWKNTEIKFYVPSTTIGKTEAPMESGPIQVFNYCGKSNKVDVEVDYAVLNYRKNVNSLADEVGLAMNTPTEIKFEYTSGLDGDAVTMIEEGLRAWRCSNTQIKWNTDITGTSFSALDPADKRNIIKAVPSNQVPTAYAGVLSGGAYIKSCNSANGGAYFVDDIDIVVNQSVNWDAFDPTHRIIFKHELGHAHLLQHAAYLGVGVNEKIVYYSYAPFVSIRSEDVAGGLHVLSNSPIILTGCSGVDVIQQMACTNATNEFVVDTNFEIVPNPFKGDFKIISKEVKVQDSCPFKIFDSTGNDVANGSLEINSTVKALRGKSTGLYLICVFVEGRTLVFKAINQ
jgi:hypothetical protein